MNPKPLGFLDVLSLNSEPARKSSTSRMAACSLPEKRFFVGKIECACHENQWPSKASDLHKNRIMCDWYNMSLSFLSLESLKSDQ